MRERTGRKGSLWRTLSSSPPVQLGDRDKDGKQSLPASCLPHKHYSTLTDVANSVCVCVCVCECVDTCRVFHYKS